MQNPLLLETHEKYYWLGFLIADGNFSFSNYTIRLRIHKKDLNHLEKFAKFCKGYVNYKISGNCIGAYLSDKNTFTTLVEKYKINSNKTKNPFNFDLIPENFKLAFITGFIDGDGSIYTSECKSIRDNRVCLRTFLKIQIDLAWIEELGKMSIFLLGENRAKIKLASHKKSNISELVINNHTFLKSLYEKILALSLPILNRKWDRCKEIPNNYYKDKTFYHTEILKQLEEGVTVKEVAKKFNVTTSSIYWIRKYKR